MAGGKSHHATDLLTKAANALSRGDCFEAERTLERALAAARQAPDLTAASDIVLRLLEARKQRMARALEVGKVTIIDQPFGEDIKVKAGCYLVQPPLVAADARRLRLAAYANNVPVMVLCREPLTQMKLVPVVAIAPGMTIRAKVRPPQDAAKPDLEWFQSALEELGDWAIDTIDPALESDRKIDVLVDSLEALAEHENLHLELSKALEEGAAIQAATPARTPKTKIKT